MYENVDIKERIGFKACLVGLGYSSVREHLCMDSISSKEKTKHMKPAFSSFDLLEVGPVI